MNILFLGDKDKEIINFLGSFGDKVEISENKIKWDSACLQNKEYLISYGYRHILKKEVLEKFANKAINLHISLLPWNRGSDPNLWSFLEDTPKGVTIHLMDKGIDTGSVIAQEEVEYSANDTLRTSYDRLSTTIENLFKKIWPDIRNGKILVQPKKTGGSYHCLNDKKKYEHLLTLGWDTPIIRLIGKAKSGATLR